MKDCNQCGKCCTNYGGGGLSAAASEIEWWQAYRPDIAEYVRDGEIWFNPETGAPLTRCPWLRKLPGQVKYVCDIYDNRPNDCKVYPVRIEDMVKDECEMLDLRDLANPQQAQNKLDFIMADSRPALQKK